jgi:predicted lipoprotein with Yx(FWY)xxD motif
MPRSSRIRATSSIRAIGVLGALAAVMLLLAACGSSGSPSTTTSTPPSSTPAPPAPSTSTATIAVSTRALPKLGAVLVDASGRTLYIFEPDAHAKVTCVGGCAQLWPPLKLSTEAKASGIGAVRSSLLGSDSDPEGGSVVTYDGWPLYTYTADTSAGQATGQAIETNGGVWYVISPSGAVVTTKP